MTAGAKNGDNGARLLSFWEPPDGAGSAIGCIATSYTFDGAFFEEHCLGRFAGFDSDPDEDRRAYLIEREEKLSQVFTCVLVDRGRVTPARSLRWHLLPVTVPRNGILHAKVALLVWQRQVRVLVGSANLTEPGYRNNYEQMAVLDFTPEGTLPLSLLGEALDLLERIRGFVPDGGKGHEPAPLAALDDFLTRVRRHVRRWATVRWPRGEPRAELIGVWPGGPSVFAQLIDRTWAGNGPEFAHVLSPFFDRGKLARRVVDALLGIMAVQGEREVSCFVSGRRLPDGVLELDAPECLREAWAPRVHHSFELVRSRDGANDSRDLHGKSLWLQRKGRAVATVGSSNFTSAGTGVGRGTVNIEANIAYVLPSTGAAFTRKCAESWPPSDEIDVDVRKVRFATDPGVHTPDPSEFDPLPAAFGLALFVPAPDGGSLDLSIDAGAPKQFAVEDTSERTILTDAEWRRLGQPMRIPRAWNEARPPSGLIVRWSGRERQERRAVWVVNVTDPTLLPPPSELSHLTLEELLEVLTSARPLHDVVGRILKRRERALETSAVGATVVDPHKKVDTRNFLLRRVTRVSQALEGMRERLERPAFTRDALLWRLHGPVGPLALARRLAEHEGQGAAFMIAEVALTLRHADLSPLVSTLGREFVRSSITGVIMQLEKLAAEHPAPMNLSRYVHDCFATVRA